MTEKERFIKALKREKIEGHVPTFELVFFLTMEKFGKTHPTHRNYFQWNQMTQAEKDAHTTDIAQVYIDTARTYHHSAIFVHPNPGDFDNVVRLLTKIRELSGDEFYLMMHGDPTMAIPTGDNMMEMSVRLYEDPDGIKKEQEDLRRKVVDFAERVEKLGTGKDRLLDGFTLCSDYCFNSNPFYQPDMFEDLICPTLSGVIKDFHDLGYYVIKHTDGNIMPIIDAMVQCKPDALHSLDPQGGVDLKYLKQHYNDKVALCGNVNCGLLQTGSLEECDADIRRSLRDGMPGYGYIFCTSNCAYTGMPLERYERMNKIWWEEGIYR